MIMKKPQLQRHGLATRSAVNLFRQSVTDVFDLSCGLRRCGARRIRGMHIEILRHKPDTPEHTIRARLSEAVSDGLLGRLGGGFDDVYAEDEGMTSDVSYPNRCSLFGDAAERFLAKSFE